MAKVLITGGAGFIGSHVADCLLDAGYKVRLFDNLDPQPHPDKKWPGYLPREVDLCLGDVTKGSDIARALQDIDMVIHLAAAVGVGQSMCAMPHYTTVNDVGTAVLLEQLSKTSPKRLVVASSMSLYGEGQEHQPIPESKPPDLTSVYALGKYVQECMCLIVGKNFNIPTVALRFFNAYGPRQTLGNPYTGVLAIFATSLLNDNPPPIFSDGLQTRDFVHVRDVARAVMLALETPHHGEVYNVGSGVPRTIISVAYDLARVMCKNIAPELTGKKRPFDVRHCYADLTKTKTRLRWHPEVSWDDGLAELAAWLKEQYAVDHAKDAIAELEERGLLQ